MVKGGPLVPAAICLVETTVDPCYASNDMAGTRSPFLAAFINGEIADLDAVWLVRGEPINREEYEFRLADAAWAAAHAPNEPAAKPREKVRLSQLSIPF